MSIQASVLTGSKEENQLTEIVSLPFPTYTSKELLVKVFAVAANPTDWKLAAFNLGSKGDIAGSDFSGVVEEVGADVTGFAKGDIVSAFLHGNSNKLRGANADYTAVDPVGAIKYEKATFNSSALAPGNHKSGPVNTFESAASINLGLGTVGLSVAHYFQISYNKEQNAGKYILIWGGATATGALAIQVAKIIYGLDVIVTASKKNTEFLKSLGADYVVDYNDSDAIKQIQQIAKGKIAYGLDTISTQETYQSLYDATEGSETVALNNLLFLRGVNEKEGRKATFSATIAYNALGEDVKLGPAEFKATPELVSNFNKFWKAVAENLDQFKSTNLKVLSPGLESTNEGLESLRQNRVSGEKIVYRI